MSNREVLVLAMTMLALLLSLFVNVVQHEADEDENDDE